MHFFFKKNDFGPGKWIVALDYKNTSLTHVRELTPTLVKQGLELFQNAMPVRLQAVYMLNVPPYLEYLLNLIKSIAPKKVMDKVRFCIKKSNKKLSNDFLFSDLLS